jgi:outer membrane protein
MKFYIVFLIVIFFNTTSLSNTNLPYKYIDLNFIVNNSEAGKNIKKKISSERDKLFKEHKKIEKELTTKRDQILSKKNVLKKEDFEIQVKEHQENVQKYKAKKNKDIENINKKGLEVSKNFIIEVEKIVVEYSKKNSIDLLLKSEALIVSNSQLDITKNILDEVNKKIKK